MSVFLESLRNTCYACGAKWGDCTCVAVPNDEGFTWASTLIVEPNVSDCGRFFIEPSLFYGKAFTDWLKEPTTVLREILTRVQQRRR